MSENSKSNTFVKDSVPSSNNNGNTNQSPEIRGNYSSNNGGNGTRPEKNNN